MPEFRSLNPIDRRVAEALHKDHSDWLQKTVGFLSEHHNCRIEAEERFIEELESYVRRLFTEARGKVSPVVLAALPVDFCPNDRINYEDIGYALFEEFLPKGRTVSRNRSPVARSGKAVRKGKSTRGRRS